MPVEIWEPWIGRSLSPFRLLTSFDSLDRCSDGHLTFKGEEQTSIHAFSFESLRKARVLSLTIREWEDAGIVRTWYQLHFIRVPESHFKVWMVGNSSPLQKLCLHLTLLIAEGFSINRKRNKKTCSLIMGPWVLLNVSFSCHSGKDKVLHAWEYLHAYLTDLFLSTA